MKDITSQNIRTLVSLIEKSERIAIVGHMKPDGDALGSCMGTYHYLSLYGKSETKVIFPHRTQLHLNFLIDNESRKDILIHEDKPGATEKAILESDLIICQDFNAFHRTDTLESVLSNATATKILIDHHLNPDRDSFDLTFSEIEISSASELVYQIMMHTPVINHDAGKIPAKSATALMTGMTTDTNNFSNSVLPSTFRMAAGLMDIGVDKEWVQKMVFGGYSESRMRLMGHMLVENMKIIPQYNASVMVLTRAMKERFNFTARMRRLIFFGNAAR